ncbi:hypothetical protein HYPSUDRAFT_210474 [Hypholoma sublateritium FD-334 SS-4]|uniref:Nephrocystin 3-like N-terminal domain-containing protein n=1 Tax=Hypholoma sublateritium (strain FD-334 SS-4) TaxID=945553 RepID=A0A0D2PMM5_HYPSF|nr:hypothetical protein HYPSUDRAFT_210474 [Hypholoma sublateritium FD-334 SS-4]
MPRKNKPASDRGRLQSTAASQAGRRSSGDATRGRLGPVPTFQGSMGHICADADDGFKHLQAHVATTAFDSNDSVDAPKCHPHTRQAVLDDIMRCIEKRIKDVLWLNGAAGAGKSAIGRSIVERCLSLGIPIARFFFFRTDSTRNGLNPVVATLAYQLMESIPELQSIIIPRIQADALIFNKSLETQFETLIFGPLLQLQKESSRKQKTLVFLLDGVDECTGHGEQVKLIQIITKFIKKQAFPLIAFFGSRVENQLYTEFRSPALSDILLQLPLDTDYRADRDILILLNESFTTIRSTHPFGRELRESNWPAQADIAKILQKASGQFIYASVVIKFISDPNQHPAQQLKIVLGLRPSGSLTPFAQLDALYRHIFSQVVDIQATSFVLAWQMFTRPLTWTSDALQIMCGTMTRAEIKVALAVLTPVLTYDMDRNHVEFLHASLPDFLVDSDRSQVYHIDRATWSAQLSTLLISPIKKKAHSKPRGWWLGKDYPPMPNGVEFAVMVHSYLPHATPTPELQNALAEMRPDPHWPPLLGIVSAIEVYLAIIRQWDGRMRRPLASASLPSPRIIEAILPHVAAPGPDLFNAKLVWTRLRDAPWTPHSRGTPRNRDLLRGACDRGGHSL